MEFQVSDSANSRSHLTWGPWLDPSPCSSSCGQGVEVGTRKCLAEGGCDGNDRRLLECKGRECDRGERFVFVRVTD